MNFNLKHLLFIAFLFLVLLTRSAKAETIKINAGVLPSIWYSTLDISKNEQVTIYGGFQNHSSSGLSYTAVVYIDGSPTLTSQFISKPNSLTEINCPWVATAGSHVAQLKITNITSLDDANTPVDTDSLISASSDEITIAVSQKITLRDVEAKISQVTTDTVASIDQTANKLADNVEAMKKPLPTSTDVVLNSITTSNSDTNTLNSPTLATNVNLAGIKTVPKTETKKANSATNSDSTTKNKTLDKESQLAAAGAGIFNNPFFVSIYNKLLDFVSLMLRNWLIALPLILALLMLLRFLTKKIIRGYSESFERNKRQNYK